VAHPRPGPALRRAPPPAQRPPRSPCACARWAVAQPPPPHVGPACKPRSRPCSSLPRRPLSSLLRDSPLSPPNRPQPPRSLPACVVFVLMVSSPPSPSSPIPPPPLAPRPARRLARGCSRGLSAMAWRGRLGGLPAAARVACPRRPGAACPARPARRRPLAYARSMPRLHARPSPPRRAHGARLGARPAHARCLRPRRGVPARGATPPCSRRAARRARGLAPGVARSRRVCAACLRRACVVCSQRVQRPARDGPGAACPWCPWPRRVRPCMRLVLARCAQPARPTLFLLYYYYYLLDEIYGLRIERRWIT
jgi:hypothetical protein